MNFIKFVSADKYNELNKKCEELIVSLEELSKAFEATEHCCPYDNEKCTKTNCFVVGGDCARRSRGKRNELITPEVKALINFLNTYAFVAWSLMEHGELGIEYLTDIAEKETDEYKALLEEFNNMKLRVVEEARLRVIEVPREEE